jgi:hypothetical protein
VLEDDDDRAEVLVDTLCRAQGLGTSTQRGRLERGIAVETIVTVNCRAGGGLAVDDDPA